MKFFGLINHSGQLLKIVIKSSAPSDSIVSDYFKSKKYLGSKDRKFISEIFYFSLRHYKLLTYFSDSIMNNFKSFFHKNISKNAQFPIYSPEHFCLLLCAFIFSSGKSNSISDSIRKISNLFGQQNSDTEFFILDDLTLYTGSTHAQLKNWMSDINITLNFIFNSLSDQISKYNPLDDAWFNELGTLHSFSDELLKLLSESESKLVTVSLPELAAAFANSAPLCLRVNTLLADTDTVSQTLAQSGIECRKSNFAPDCLVLAEKQSLHSNPLYQNGLIEIQDEGSQLISMAVCPREGASILDSCAGAGGKSLHLAALQSDTGNICSSDVQFMRIKELPFRAQRCGVQSITTYIYQNDDFKPLGKTRKPIREGMFDYVLIDAPCSGIGTARRDPLKKLKLTKRIVEKINKSQREIIRFYSRFVKPGGVLVYATCSIFPQENEMIVDEFLEEFPNFETDNLFELFSEKNIKIEGLKDKDYYVTLYPHIHGTDGFFMSRMVRVE